MANLKSITELPVAESAEGLNLIVNDNGSAKQIAASAVGAQADWKEVDSSSPAFIKNKPSKELVYEWNFSADDDVQEIVENVDEDLSWLTKHQDDIGFEISMEFYGYDYRWTQEEGDHDYVFYENIYATVNSTETPSYSRYVNTPFLSDTSFIIKESLNGWLEGGGGYEAIIEATNKILCIFPVGDFHIMNNMHYDVEANLPVAVQNGGCIVVFSDSDSPLKSVKIYKITR